MTLRRRLFLFVALIIAIGLPSAAGVFAYVSWQSVLERTKQDGTLVAQLLAQSISFIRQVPVAIHEIVGQSDVQAQADIVAHLTQIAQSRKAPTMETQSYPALSIAVRNEPGDLGDRTPVAPRSSGRSTISMRPSAWIPG